MKMVKDAKSAWRWFSVQALALSAALPMIWAQLPPETRMLIPPKWLPWIITVVALAGIVGRLIEQGPKQ